MPRNRSDKPSARLIWDSKGEKPEEKDYSITELDYIFPHPLWEIDKLFGEQLDIQKSRNREVPNRLMQGDNLAVIKLLLDSGYKEKIDLIYIDPPYLSESNYLSKIRIGKKENQQWLTRTVFKDKWERGLDSYLDNLYSRLFYMRELLSEKGSIFVHLDWHVSHYVKLLLDELFSPDNFLNEIVWCYGGGSGTKRHFHRKHDLILWYAKGEDYIFNPQYRPYSRGTLERGLTRIKGDKYRLSNQGAIMQDWWTDINKILSPTARENLKFPTQKPAALLRRLLASASNPGSIVADFYAGSGTTAEVCEEMDRNWIICDSSEIAVQTSRSRLLKNNARPFSFEKIEDKEKNNTGNKIVLKKPEIYAGDEEFCNVNIGIESYAPATAIIEKDRLNTSFTALIAFWEIDLDYGGENFFSDMQIIREKNSFDDSIPLDISLRIAKNGVHKIAIKLFDIMGDSIMDVLEFET